MQDEPNTFVEVEPGFYRSVGRPSGREENLLDMGYASYNAYLRSTLWRQIRAEQLRAHPDCWVCARSAECVHHKSYSRRVLEGKKRKRLMSLCHSCHHKAHDGPPCIQSANNRLYAMRQAHKGQPPQPKGSTAVANKDLTDPC